MMEDDFLKALLIIVVVAIVIIAVVDLLPYIQQFLISLGFK